MFCIFIYIKIGHPHCALWYSFASLAIHCNVVAIPSCPTPFSRLKISCSFSHVCSGERTGWKVHTEEWTRNLLEWTKIFAQVKDHRFLICGKIANIVNYWEWLQQTASHYQQRGKTMDNNLDNSANRVFTQKWVVINIAISIKLRNTKLHIKTGNRKNHRHLPSTNDGGWDDRWIIQWNKIMLQTA